jgi:hypothetical protein
MDYVCYSSTFRLSWPPELTFGLPRWRIESDENGEGERNASDELLELGRKFQRGRQHLHVPAVCFISSPQHAMPYAVITMLLLSSKITCFAFEC